MHRVQWQEDEQFMKECLDLARKGMGRVSPNPLVGAILVKGGKVIGRGYHRKFGTPHAEVNAIQSARSPVPGSTLYVNLEPCNIHGKTPPCTNLIISSMISRVVIGMKDPNPLVSGRGIRQLQRAGIRTTLDVLKEDCSRLNEVFSKYITTGLPFVTVKVAQTLDGKIADEHGHSKWISGPGSRRLVHTLRAQHDAVLVGAGTVRRDNPRLTARGVNGRDPTRVILDGRFSSGMRANVFRRTKKGRTILFISRQFDRLRASRREALARRGVTVIALNGTKDGALRLHEVLRELGSFGIASVLVEGGAKTFSEFLNEQAVDKLLLFISPRIFGRGLDSFPDLKRISTLLPSNLQIGRIDGDIMITANLHKM
ncbi:MAG TPA: bifunctional diaminohydroxyphosphoribosylaminopyrimidine deaminase/5-amino-6-(5-phosphoribosylamino)uracil reductase RibD [Bacteroidota bacterium]|jgi:diaminohydroxyphosphoribosylaminopyrimidine deaminase/5-amino-6-(5-phosphoribosylamino)uracil reductase|nr:bifunctional diaminohydroxyphosphoribosylaminopyrimidine deaminase/5-amino-6-(5-phosphoribosylamino)uracil reductase RibD [Bacteroidota bacterium]